MRAALFAFAAGLAAMPAVKAAPDALRLLEPSPAAAAVTAKCTPLSFSVYFGRNDADVSATGKTALDLASSAVRGCAIAAVAIEADQDTVSTPEGRRLSGLRGAALLKELGARGVAAESVVIAASENGAPASANASVEEVRLSIVPAHKRFTVRPPAPKSPGVGQDI
jgi:outer membrane protein OmpA-like peptidoglycan-associated protein